MCHNPNPVSRGEKKIREEINEMQIQSQRVMVTKLFFFVNINKVNTPLAKLAKRKNEKIQINKSRGEKGNIVANTKEVYNIIRKYIENLYFSKIENTGTYNLPKLKQ